MNNFINKEVIKILSAILIFLVGIFLGWFLKGFFHEDLQDTVRILEAGTYKFINPLLAVDSVNKSSSLELLRNEVDRYIEQKVLSGGAKNISFYFRSLDTGGWTGVGEDERFAPASMLKVATMVAYLKLAESDPALLSKPLYYDREEDKNSDSYFKPDISLSKGFHTVDDLLRKMIIDSGNNSDHILKQNIKIDDLLRVYTHLKLPLPQVDEDDFMSAKSYSLIFRVLYNSTYLSREMSEKALALLSQTKFNKGIVAGVSNITVAHKFGERTLVGPDGSVIARELHDCGIVYAPNRYFICVMTRGDSFESLAEIISHISKLALSFISKTEK